MQSDMTRDFSGTTGAFQNSRQNNKKPSGAGLGRASQNPLVAGLAETLLASRADATVALRGKFSGRIDHSLAR
jgi:hypothetical protein